MEAKHKVHSVDDSVDHFRSGVHSAVDKVANATIQAADVLGQKGGQLKDVEEQFLENCRGYIHKNPVASLGMAVGAGFLLSRLISSR